MAHLKFFVMVLFSLLLIGCKTETKEVEKIVQVEKIVEVEKKLPQLNVLLTGVDTLPVSMLYPQVLIGEQKPSWMMLTELKVTYSYLSDDGRIQPETTKNYFSLITSSFSIDVPKTGTYWVKIEGVTNETLIEQVSYEGSKVYWSGFVTTDLQQRVNLVPFSSSYVASTQERFASKYDYIKTNGETCYLLQDLNWYDAYSVSNTHWELIYFYCSSNTKLVSFVFESEKGGLEVYENATPSTYFPAGSKIFVNKEFSAGVNMMAVLVSGTEKYKLAKFSYEIDQVEKNIVGNYSRSIKKVDKGTFVVTERSEKSVTFASGFESIYLKEVCLESSSVLKDFTLQGKKIAVLYQQGNFYCSVISNTNMENISQAFSPQTLTVESSSKILSIRLTGQGYDSGKEIVTQL